QGERARYRGLRKNLFDLRRHAALTNLKVVDNLRVADYLVSSLGGESCIPAPLWPFEWCVGFDGTCLRTWAALGRARALGRADSDESFVLGRRAAMGSLEGFDAIAPIRDDLHSQAILLRAPPTAEQVTLVRVPPLKLAVCGSHLAP
ncbi:MAG TPA: hypothetical protein VIV60_30955, partial [Polyangiaceae bacterium]